MKNSFWFIAALILVSSCKDEEEIFVGENHKAVLSNQLAGSVLWYQQADEASFLYHQGYKRAEELMLQNLGQLPKGKSGAVVLDIDETVLDNSPYEARLVLDSSGYESESWAKWVSEASADTLPGVFSFLKKAEDKGVGVFYISNRKEAGLEATIKNLKAFNLPNADKDHVLLKTSTSDKTERRKIVTDSYEVLVYVGDQMTDFAQDYKEISLDSIFKRFVLLPNPMYGSFEEKVYNGDFGATDSTKISLRRKSLKPKR